MTVKKSERSPQTGSGIRKPPSRLRPTSSYLKLIRAFPIRPIRSEDELDQAIAVVDSLLLRGGSLDDQERDYLEVLSREIELYEAEAYPPKVSEAGILRHLLDANEKTLSQVAAESGIVLSSLSAILNGKRKLNLKHIRVLAGYFKVDPAVFLE